MAHWTLRYLRKVMFMSKKSENDVLKIVHGLSCRHLRGKWLTSAFAERRMTTRNTVKCRKSVRCARALTAISVPPPRPPTGQPAQPAACTDCARAGHAAPPPAWITLHQSTYDM